MPCTDSTNIALRIEDSRIPSLASLASGLCANMVGIIISGTTSTMTQKKIAANDPEYNQK